MMKVQETEYCDVLQSLVEWHERTFVGAEFDGDKAHIPLTEFAQGALIASDAATLLRRMAYYKGVSDSG